MAYHTLPRAKKADGSLSTLKVTDDGYLKIDMQDTTVVAEFTPGSTVKVLDKDGTNQLVVDSSGKIGVSSFPALSSSTDSVKAKILDKDGTNQLVVDSSGKIGIANLPNVTIGTNAALVAGEAHVGEVGGSSAQVIPVLAADSSAFTVNTTAYHANDVVAGVLKLANAMRITNGTGILQSLFVQDVSGQKPALEILIFNANPSSSTTTDHGALSVHANDTAKVIRRLSVATSDYVTVGNVYIADLSPGGRLLSSSGSADLYAVIICTGTPDFVAATDLTVRFGIMRD
jgi:hypothetical protein